MYYQIILAICTFCLCISANPTPQKRALPSCGNGPQTFNIRAKVVTPTDPGSVDKSYLYDRGRGAVGFIKDAPPRPQSFFLSDVEGFITHATSKVIMTVRNSGAPPGAFRSQGESPYAVPINNILLTDRKGSIENGWSPPRCSIITPDPKQPGFLSCVARDRNRQYFEVCTELNPSDGFNYQFLGFFGSYNATCAQQMNLQVIPTCQ